MKITEKIDTINTEIRNGNTTLGDRVKVAAMAAVTKGLRDAKSIATPECRALMEIYASDSLDEIELTSPESQDQLRRLCGEDSVFQGNEWADECLAYIACDSTCGPDTYVTTGALRTVKAIDDHKGNGMQTALDA